MKEKTKALLIGIDEVGRGPLAGPVTVAAVLLLRKKPFVGLKDSKKLSERQRETWFRILKKDKDIFYAVASFPPKVIDRVNVSEAANRAATKAFSRLLQNRFSTGRPIRVYLDGGLYLKRPRISNQYVAKTIIKGDEKFNVIKLASIVAKVTRDRYMKGLAKRYPYFNFEVHKGYGTRKHLAVLKRSGPSDVHRLTFIRKHFTIK